MLAVGLLALTTLSVGPGKPFARMEAALAVAKAGDEINVYPGDYRGTAVLVRLPRLTFRAMGQVKIDGAGFDYSGVGSTPRAIFQVDPGADNVVIQGFDLAGAHNASCNGAGVRINQARNVTIRNCDIHDNDMGIMSNGANDDKHAAEAQMISECKIHGNGNGKQPGYNHNLYLGGTSVTLDHCEIYSSLTGHNVKSRAHLTRIEYCFIHDSANRECDFVEAWDTERPGSDAVLVGNVIAKDPKCPGNRVVIHFGQEKGLRDGTIYLVNNTIVTPFMGAVLSLSSPKAHAVIGNDVIVNSEQSAPVLVDYANGASGLNVTGGFNWMSPRYSLNGTQIDASTRYESKLALSPDFVVGAAANHFQAGPFVAKGPDYLHVPWSPYTTSLVPTHRYVGHGTWQVRGDFTALPPPFIGAG